VRLLGRDGPDLPPLPEGPKVRDLPEARLGAAGKYLGTTSGGQKVRARGLGGSGSVRIQLSDEALDVVRMGAPFRIPVTALQGARHAENALVVVWRHGGQVLETTFGLPGDHGQWVRKISKLARKQEDAV
jgi:hypothetical protein